MGKKFDNSRQVVFKADKTVVTPGLNDPLAVGIFFFGQTIIEHLVAGLQEH
jgi:hypothetical protein